MMNLYSLAAFKVLCLSLVSESLIIMYVLYKLLELNLSQTLINVPLILA